MWNHDSSFYVLAQGYGNYNATIDQKKFNLVNPHMRITIVMPRGGWVVIIFKAKNPSMYIVFSLINYSFKNELINFD